MSLSPASQKISVSGVKDFVSSLFSPMMHAARIASVADATVGVLHSGSLAIHAIGAALALADERTKKHATKQVDRLLSNPKLDVWNVLSAWTPFVLGARTEAVIALDWTDFDKDDHTTLVASLVTTDGRATPLLWRTVRKSTLSQQRNALEDEFLSRLRELIPDSVRVTALCDRGFADQKLYEFLKELRFDFIIRFRECIYVTDTKGTTLPAAQWVPSNGRPRKLNGACVTEDRYPVGAVVCVKESGMKGAWCLATSRADLAPKQIIRWYGKRFSIEETFRDQKDLRFGMGLSSTHIQDERRRDRLLLLCALSTALLTLLGAAGESLGYDRMLKVNTVKTRTHSLLRQGAFYFQAIATYRADWTRALLDRFAQLLSDQPWFSQTFGVI